jgi:hypothetical protein
MVLLGGAGLAAQSGASAPLTVRLSMESVFDAVRESGDGSAAGPAAPAGASRLRAEVAHERSSRRAALRFWGGVNADRVWTAGPAPAAAAAVTVDSSITLTRRTRLDLADRVSSASLDLFNGGAPGAASASRVVTSGSELVGARTLTQDARVALTRTLNRGSLAVFSGTYTYSATGPDRVISRGVAARLQRSFGAFLGWHAGYGFGQASYSGPARQGDQQRHDVDFGLDYARPLSFWRHTTFAIGTGSTLLVEPATGRQMRLVVTSSIERQVTRTWAARVEYSRPIQYVAGLTQPLLSDAVRVGLDGRLTRDVMVTAIAAAARGTVGAAGGQRFRSVNGSVRIARRLGPEWELQAEYQDARYQFAGGVSPGGAIPAAFARRSFRAGLAWAPGIVR